MIVVSGGSRVLFARKHVITHPRKRAQVKIPNLLLFSRRCRICRRSVGIDSVCLQKVFMKDRVPLIFWNCWEPLAPMGKTNVL